MDIATRVGFAPEQSRSSSEAARRRAQGPAAPDRGASAGAPGGDQGWPAGEPGPADARYRAPPRGGAGAALVGRRPRRRDVAGPLGGLLPDVPGAHARRADDRQVPQDRDAPPLGRRGAPGSPDPATGGTAHGRAVWQEHGLSSPPRSAHRSSPATCCVASSSSLSGPASAASPPARPPALRGELPAGGRNPHEGRPEHLGHSPYAITADIYSHAGPASSGGRSTVSTRRSAGARCCPSHQVR